LGWRFSRDYFDPTICRPSGLPVKTGGGERVSKKFEYTDHTADLGLRAYGATLEILFANAAEALLGVMVSPDTVGDRHRRLIEVHATALDDLLVCWLNEILYLFDAQGFFCRRFEFETMKSHVLRATVFGEPFDPARHVVKTGVKAATYHQLFVKHENDQWVCRVILDL